MTTLSELLLSQSNNQNKIYYINENGDESFVRYSQLIHTVQKYATILMSEYGLKKNTRVILHTSAAETSVTLFWSVIMTGATVIPVSAPADHEYQKNRQEIIRFKQICDITQSDIILCGEQEDTYVRTMFPDKTCITEEILKRENVCLKQIPIQINEDDIALLIFTSGSTGMPKGVPLSHKNILSGIKAEQSFLKYTKEHSFLNWFPLEHVVPLIVFHLLPFFIGAEQIQVDSSYILADIKRWFVLLSKYQTQITWAPDFAYGMIMEKRAELDCLELDLTHLYEIMNGGEAINYAQDRRCLEFLEKRGLRSNAMVPIWGMTEATVGITLTRNFGMNRYKNAVAVGQVLDTYEVRICNQGIPVEKDEIEGDIQVRGPAVFKGYLNSEESTVFTKDGWFVTGDIGVWKNGEIIICGRSAEKLIVNGVNISTNEIASWANQALQKAGYDCFLRAWVRRNLVTQKDELYIFTSGKEEEAKIIFYSIQERFHFAYNYIVFVEDKEIRRTPLGKVDKKKMFEAFDSGEFTYRKNGRLDLIDNELLKDTKKEWSDRKRMLMELWAYMLNLYTDQFTPDDSFFVLGGTSAKVVEMISKIEDLFRIRLTAMEFVQNDTVNKLLSLIDKKNNENSSDISDEEECEILLL